MKKICNFILLLLLVPLLTGCSANVVGKFDNFNETFKGTIDLDMQGNGIIKVKSAPSNIICKGKGWITFIPISSRLLGTCKGQQGEAQLKCNDGRIITGEWKCQSCTKISGTAESNKNESITFFITPKNKRAEEILDNYKTEISSKPGLDGKEKDIMESLF